MRDKLVHLALAAGFDHAQWIDAEQIVLDRRFRQQCADNACGIYGKCYMCPPDIGEIHELMDKKIMVTDRKNEGLKEIGYGDIVNHSIVCPILLILH